jgi:hypothetical protein
MESSQSNENITTFTDSIVFNVIKDIASRAEIGLAKYNMTMDREDLTASDWCQNLYEEILDSALYLKRLKKDMLAMEEELRAFRAQATIKEEWSKLEEEDKNKKLKYKYGTEIADSNVPEPNKEKQSMNIKYAWHR